MDRIKPKHNPNLPRQQEEPGTGAETVPPGATAEAEDRPITPPTGPNEDADVTPTIDKPPTGHEKK